MQDETRQDIRVLLKKFGVKADEAVVSHLARLDRSVTLRLRLSLEDLTDYGADAPPKPLALRVEGEVRA